MDHYGDGLRRCHKSPVISDGGVDDSLSKNTVFYETLEEKQANQADIKKGFSFLDKDNCEALPMTRFLNKSGRPIPGQPDLPVEEAAEIKILSK